MMSARTDTKRSAGAGLPQVPEDGFVTAAEFRTRLDRLGVPRTTAAALLRASYSSVKNWAAGRYPVPGWVSLWLDWAEGKQERG